jgi:hypothetical protein
MGSGKRILDDLARIPSLLGPVAKFGLGPGNNRRRQLDRKRTYQDHLAIFGGLIIPLT